MDWGTIEELAREVHDGTGYDGGDAFILADLCGLDVCHGRRQRLSGASGRDVVYVDTLARPERQHGAVAHEVAHWVLFRAGESSLEEHARPLGGALLVARRALQRDLAEVGALDLHELKRRHPNASHELLARRVAEVRDAIVSIVDAGRLRVRVASPWLPRPRAQLERVERTLVEAALDHGQTVRLRDVAAIPLLDGIHRRVIVIRAL